MSTHRMHRDSVKLRPGGVQTKSAPSRRSPTKDQPQRLYQINWLLLAATIVAGVILIPSAYAWHNHQLRRNASVFLRRAEDLEAESKWNEAADNFFTYIRLSPEGPDADEARIHLAQCFDRIAKTYPQKQRAANLYSTAIGLMPERIDLRRRRAELHYETGQYVAALNDAQYVLDSTPEDPVALAVKAQSTYYANRRTSGFAVKDVKALYENAIAHAPNGADQIKLALELTKVLHQDLHGAGEATMRQDANAVLESVVAKNPECIDVWIGRYQYRIFYREPRADEDLDRALALDTKRDHVSVRIYAGKRALGKKQLDEAVAYFEQAIAAAPTDTRGYSGLGRTHLQRNDPEKAINAFKQGIEANRSGDMFNLQLLLLETLLADARLTDADALLGSLEAQLASLASRNVVPEMEMAQRRSTIDALRGQWHIARGEYRRAVEFLRRSLGARTGTSEASAEESVRRARIFVSLGRCYLKQGTWDEAAAAFTEASTLQPESIEPKIEAARAWQDVGRLDETIRLYQQVAGSPKAPAGVWVELVEALLRQQLTLSPEARDWKELEDALQRGQKASPDSFGLKMLEAQVADLRGGSSQTLDVLEKARASDPNSARLTERLILAYENAGRAADADRVLQDFERRKHEEQDAPALLSIRTSLLVKRGQFDEAERLLHDQMQHVPLAARPQLELWLAGIALSANRRDEARSQFAKLAEAPGADPRLVPLLADLALAAGDLKDLARWEDRLREQEGSEGTLWRYYKVRRLLDQAGNNQDFDYSEAERLTAFIVNKRQLWGAGYVLKAQIAQKRRQPDLAIAAYQQAIECGERRPIVFEQLMRLLIATGRYDEATKYLEQLGNSKMQTSELAGLTVPLYLRQGNLERAIAAAKQNVELHPVDPTNHVWLGHSLSAAGRNEEAEAAFRRAVELAPEDVQVWHGLFNFFVRTKQIPAARETFEKIGKIGKLTAEQRPMVLAQGFEALGDRKTAREYYEQALLATPKEAAVYLRLAGFFAREDAVKAEDCYRKAVQLAPKSPIARRELMSFLITRGGDQKLDDAAMLLKQAENEGPSDAKDQRLKAMLNLKRGGPDQRREARRLLVDLADMGQAQPNDRLLLATLLEGDGQSSQAIAHLRAIATREDAPAAHIVAYVEVLLRNNRADETGRWLNKLNDMDPNSFDALALRARAMVATKKRDEAVTLIDEYLARRLTAASSDADKASLFLNVGNLCQQVGLDPQAERCFRSLQPLMPSGYAPLAGWLASHKRSTEAVDLCLKAASSDSTSGPAISLARVLMIGTAESGDIERAEQFLSQATKKFPDDPDLIFSVATWRFLNGDSNEALSMFRKVLALQPKNVLARNNLASLLAERPGGWQEALQLVDEAIGMAGKSSELLDTKGLILMREGRLEPAIALFQEATSVPVPDPRHLFHLSLAYRQTENFSDSRKALDRARARELTTRLLSPNERQLLPQLERDVLK